LHFWAICLAWHRRIVDYFARDTWHNESFDWLALTEVGFAYILVQTFSYGHPVLVLLH